MRIELTPFAVSIDVPDSTAVRPRRAAAIQPLQDLAGALRQALDQPRDFPPLRRALTPDDRVVVVVDDRLPTLGVLVTELLNYLGEAGITPEGITLLSPHGAKQPWINDLPDAWQDVRTEVHDPGDRRRHSYLASTKRGRRLYLNRTLIDADQAIVLSSCRYNAQFGYACGSTSLFPALSDRETIRQTASQFSLEAPNETAWPLRAESEEVAWLLGVPFMLQIIEGEGDKVAHVLGGTVESLSEGRRLLDSHWRLAIDRKAQTVVTTVSGEAARHDFGVLVDAAVCAARVVEPGGRIVLLCNAAPEPGEGMLSLRDSDTIAVAARRIQERETADQVTAQSWLNAAHTANIYLLSGLADDFVEDLFATPLQDARQVQRLLDTASSCLVLPDGHKTLAIVEGH